MARWRGGGGGGLEVNHGRAVRARDRWVVIRHGGWLCSSLLHLAGRTRHAVLFDLSEGCKVSFCMYVGMNVSPNEKLFCRRNAVLNNA